MNIDDNKPNIIVLATGHSGSSVLSEMICRMGWNIKDSPSRFRAEYKPMRNLNHRLMQGEAVPQEELIDLLQNLEEPWVLKDPRFAITLEYWYTGLKQYAEISKRNLFLVWMHRDFAKTEASFLRRREYVVVKGKKVAFEKVSKYSLEDAYNNCPKFFQSWPWAKIAIDYEDIKKASRVFDPKRDNPKHRKSGKGGF